jgi:hypothetical protein
MKKSAVPYATFMLIALSLLIVPVFGEVDKTSIVTNVVPSFSANHFFNSRQ